MDSKTSKFDDVNLGRDELMGTIARMAKLMMKLQQEGAVIPIEPRLTVEDRKRIRAALGLGENPLQ
jgi:hypothetical protein